MPKFCEAAFHVITVGIIKKAKSSQNVELLNPAFSTVPDFRRGSIPVSTVLRQSVRFFIINIFLVKNFKLSKLISGKWFGQSVNIPSEILRNPAKGTLGS